MAARQLRRRPVLGRRSAPTRARTATPHLYGFPYKIDVKSLVWYVPENFEDAGYEVPDDDGGAEGADRADRRRRRHAVVHRPRLRRRDRLAGDRLGRGPDAAHAAAGSLRPVGHERDPVHRRAHRRGDRRVRLVRQERRQSSTAARRRSPRPTSATARRASSARRRSATCTTRRRSSRPSSRRARRSATTRTSSTCRPMPTRPTSASRCSAPARSRIITKDTPAARAFIEFLKTPIAHEIWMAQSSFLTPFKSVEHRRLRQRAR